MKNYKVEFIKFTGQWMVINLNTGVAHSAWNNRQYAEQISRALNAAAVQS